MNTQNNTVVKLAETALLAALCYVSFTFLQIKIPVPGGDATSIHIGNAFCVLAALLLGGVYGGLAGAIGMGIADIMDPVYITGAPKTFVLKFCIGLIVGLVAHKVAKINESTDKKYVFKWSVIASVAGLAFNVIAGVAYLQTGYFCRFFKKKMGVTFLEYQNEYRLSFIYKDLINTKDPVHVILERHGFTNYKLFRRMFQEHFGCTPTKVRENMRK